jgi:hypothetical protein
VAHDKLAAGDVGQEFGLCDLLVLSMALYQVLLFLLVDIAHVCHSLLAQTSHDLFFVFTEIVI